MRNEYLAEDKARKQKQRQLRNELGLPDLKDNRGILGRMFGSKKSISRRSSRRSSDASDSTHVQDDRLSLKQALMEWEEV